MTSLKKLLLACVCFTVSPIFAAGPASPKAQGSRPGATAPLSAADRYARRCLGQDPDRGDKPQGTLLWGTKRGWDSRQAADERSSVLVSAELDGLIQADRGVTALRLEGGRLEISPAVRGSVIGTVLQGTTSDGKPTEVAICGAEPSSEDSRMVWYRIEAWNPVAQEWENPCVASGHVPDPRALAVSGTWDASGAHHDTPGKLTFACENGVITKCTRWGYKPWASKDGKSLGDLHQACMRMARADYCGNGRTHTHDDTVIDIYDSLGVLSRSTEPTADWNPALGAFEAAWAPDGASCLARTRDGRAMATILQECPGRFQQGAAVDLGDGDTVQRPDMKPTAMLLRNRSYGVPPGTVPQSASK